MENNDSLASLGVKILSQNTLERKVAYEADSTILAKDIEVETKRLSKAQSILQRHQKKLNSLQFKLDNGIKYGTIKISEKGDLQRLINELKLGDLKNAQNDVDEITQRLNTAKEDQKSVKKSNIKVKIENEEEEIPQSLDQLPSETREEFLIRTGKITAFGNTTGFTQEGNLNRDKEEHSHVNLIQPGFTTVIKTEKSESPPSGNETEDDDDFKHKYDQVEIEKDHSPVKVEIFSNEEEEEEEKEDSYIPDDDSGDNIDLAQDEDNDDEFDLSNDEQLKKRSRTKEGSGEPQKELIDDGNEFYYRHRLAQWEETRSSLRKKFQPDYVDDPNIPEWEKPHPTEPDAVLNESFKVPGDIFPSLFDYQKTCVQWLYELHTQKVGGIIGDEMGLGKTVQMISFLAGLHYSGKLNGPVLVVCPATVLKQWCAEFQKWWPAFRTVILHSIGEGLNGKKRKKNTDEFGYPVEDLEEDDEIDDDLQDYDKVKTIGKTIENKTVRDLINRIVKDGHIILTTYAGVRIYSQYLLPVKWGYVVLDEGHKIRNPDSYITITCKQLRTPNRIILSGTPIQNNLVELWSLFDFVFPGKLGTLPVFQRQFCIPINLGGYANATNIQVQAAYKCAVILKELISPYMLRRVKADVARDLPKKSEMVLFCKLTPEQRTLYKDFLSSNDLERILKGKRNALFGIDTLRKICNHPNLVDLSVRGKKKSFKNSVDNLCSKSGKLQVVTELLKLWTSEGRKILLFSQTRQMLDILEDLLKAMNNEQDYQYPFMRMDGTTPIGKRQNLVDTFNNDPDYKIFLLTTRVGGLGVNLTGASRVIIYDPDWNPSTDMQARERAWRLGQKQDVVIYRLMIAGSIEEKIYHRQIFKQFLTNKILKDPKQKRFFKMTDLYDLFSLGDDDVQGTETADLFGTTETNYDGSKERKKKFKSRDIESNFKGMAKMESYQGPESQSTMFDDEESKSHQPQETDENNGVLSKIFQSSNIHSTLSHDSVLTSSNPEGDVDHSQRIVDSEAERIANDAMSALRHSRRETRKTGVYVPTWTGKHGKAGKEVKKRASPVVTRHTKLKISPKQEGQPKEEDLITRVATYLSSLDSYFSTSGDILDNLKINVHDEQTVKEVRNMLKLICNWNKAKKGWELKEEYR